MTTRIMDAADHAMQKQVESFLLGHANGHFLQAPQWRHVKTQWKWKAVTVWDDAGDICGVMSVLVRKLPMAHSILYAPRGPVCDRTDRAVLDALFEAAKQIAKEDRALLMMVDPDSAEEKAELRAIMKSMGFCEKESSGYGNVQPQSVFRLDLSDRDADSLMMNFSAKTRYNIRLAQRKGVQITRYTSQTGIPESVLDSFCTLMDVTGKRDGFITRSREYFARILDAFGENAVLFLAEYQNEWIAGSLEILYGNKAWYLYGASSNQHRNMMPNYLLQWEMICAALERGCEIYDFRGVPAEHSDNGVLQGLYRFKQGFRGKYTEFCGLFIHYSKPILGRFFYAAVTIFRKLRRLFGT